MSDKEAYSHWKDKRVLITGGTGFIGTALSKRLYLLGATVKAIGSRNCNLENQTDVDSYFKWQPKQDYIFHMAAWTRPGDFCLYHSAEQFNKNMLMHVNVLKAWKKYHDKAKFIGIGASCSYPGNLYELKEIDYWNGNPHESLHSYAMTKRMLFAGQSAYNRQYGLKSIHPVFATLYGPHDYFDNERSHCVSALIARFGHAVSNNEPEVIVWGDGYQEREFIHIDDQIDALLLAAEKYDDGLINLGSGYPTTIKELAKTIAEAYGYTGKIVYDPTKFVGIKRKVLNIDLAKKTLGWFPKISLKDGIQNTVNWYIGRYLGVYK
jgi:GDP-L-fucose synthase